MYIPSVQCRDGEHFIYWLNPPIMNKLRVGYYEQISKFTLMDYIDEKYNNGALDILCSFSEAVRKSHQNEIGVILDGFTDGDIW